MTPPPEIHPGLAPDDCPGTVVAALDIGGTHATSALVDTAMWQLVTRPQRHSVDAAASATDIIATFAQSANATAVVATDAGLISHWGVAMPDPFDYVTGIARFRGVGKFERLNGCDIGLALRTAITPSPRQISFINDADAFTLGEWLNGAASTTTRCAGLTLGSGVGSGWLAAGQIVESGPDVPPGGRAHRLTVNGAHLEDVMSRRAIRRAYADATGDDSPDVREICQRARQGDLIATRTLRTALYGLGTALGPWFSRFQAEIVVVGGSMTASWDVLEEPFLNGFASVAALVPVAVAQDADRAPLLGAAHHVRQVSQSR